MFSKPTEPRSIASQLVLRFTPAAAFLLFCALGVLYWIVVQHAFEEDNDVLADKIFAARTSLSKAGGPITLNEQLNAVPAGEHAAYWVRIVDSLGRTAAETPGMNTFLPSNIFPTAESSHASAPSPRDYKTHSRLFSLVATLAEADGQSYTIQVAQDRSADARFTKEFGALFAIVLGFGVLASAMIAITVTRRGLLPLAEMTRSLKRTGPTTCRSESHRPDGRVSCNRSRSPSTRCWIGSKIPLPGSPNFRPISRTNFARPSPIFAAKRK